MGSSGVNCGNCNCPIRHRPSLCLSTVNSCRTLGQFRPPSILHPPCHSGTPAFRNAALMRLPCPGRPFEAVGNIFRRPVYLILFRFQSATGGGMNALRMAFILNRWIWFCHAVQPIVTMNTHSHTHTQIVKNK